MIERLQAVATRIHLLRFVALGTGIFCLVAVAFMVFSPPSQEGDRYLIPGIVGLLWSASAYNFVDIFRSVPNKAAKSEKLWKRIKRGALRAWYWLMALIFFGTTLAVVSVSSRLLSIWMKDYAG